MATPGEKLAESLEKLKSLQDKEGIVAIRSKEINRVHRERLTKNGFIKEVTKGWYIASDPNEKTGETTSWYTSYWQFCARYLEKKYGNDYCISPDQSLLIHTGNNAVPAQLIIRTPKAVNFPVELLHNTSLFPMTSSLPDKGDIVVVNNLRMLSLPSALIHSSTIMFEKNPVDMRTALALIGDSSELLSLLMKGSHTVIAGRLAGAFRNIGQVRIADDIVKAMKSAEYNVREVDPFISESIVKLSFRDRSPYSNRIKLMWNQIRPMVINHFPNEPGLPKSADKYLKSVDEIYVTDAYHSLSIERYTASTELIEKVRSGNWDLEDEDDKKHRDAMAAKGYWLASQSVKKTIQKILNGENSGTVLNYDHVDWYRQLFLPSVTAGILNTSDLAGYRTNQVYISNSMHVPLSKDAVRDVMPTLFELLESEEHAGVRAVLGHFVFVYIHPFMDGNGRMARFLMNAMLASGGYPWTVIPVEERDTYMSSLEMASVEEDYEVYIKFIAYLVNESLKGTPVAKPKGKE
jgi:Fic/DOC family